MLSEEVVQFREPGFYLTVSGEAFEFLRRGIHTAFGARPMNGANIHRRRHLAGAEVA